MNKEQYLAQRKLLLDGAEAFIKEGKTEEANVKMVGIETLDNKWEETKLLNANMNALKDKVNGIDIVTKSEVVENAKKVDRTTESVKFDKKVKYQDAWAKVMMGKKLDSKEQDVFNSINSTFNNAYTHDTGNTSILIPETVAAGIFKRAEAVSYTHLTLPTILLV